MIYKTVKEMLKFYLAVVNVKKCYTFVITKQPLNIMSINAKEVIEGWKNFIVKSDLVEEEALKKAKICAECPFIKKSMLLSYVKETGEFKDIEGYKCGICGCPTSALIRSNKKCEHDPPKW